MDRYARDLTKTAQRAVLSAVSSEGGGLVVLLLCSVSLLLLLLLAQGIRLTLYPPSCAEYDGRPPFEELSRRSRLGDGVGLAIDAVYTWVNGTDEALLEAIEEYRPTTDAESRARTNRYRDNGELRYSLRSLERYAPWVRRIFLVTNGQIPSWLDLSVERLTVVTHAEIFDDPSHLPTFSSPSIESHLHKIPGLSRRFIYLNDDVMFGAPVFVDDFFTSSRGQKVFLSWNVPDCAAGCSDMWFGDGFCDTACNVTACGFDGGDCNGKSVMVPGAIERNSANKRSHDYYDGGGWGEFGYGYDIGLGASEVPPASSEFSHFHASEEADNVAWQEAQLKAFRCGGGCRAEWIGDRTCDYSCNLPECAFDAGDCASSVERLSELTSPALIPRPPDAQNPECESCDAFANLTLVWPLQTLVLNLTGAFPFGASGRLVHASHDSPFLVRVATTLAPKPKGYGNEQGLVVLFENDQKHVASALGSANGRDRIHVGFEFRGTGEGANSLGFEPGLSFGTPVTDHSALGRQLRLVLNITFLLPVNYTSTLSGVDDGMSEKQAVSSEENVGLDSAYFSVEEDEDVLTKVESTSLYDSPPWDLDSSFGDGDSSPPPPPDTFAQSLRHVSKLLNEAYGRANSRKVPAHMPHFLDRDIIVRLVAKWPEEWRATSSHRFRSGDDMQFSFSYFHFLMNEPISFDVEAFWHERLDVDGDGILGPNELRTLAALLSTRDLDVWPLKAEDVIDTAQLIWDEARVAGAVGAMSALANWASGRAPRIELHTLKSSPTALRRLEEREAGTRLWATDGEDAGWMDSNAFDAEVGGERLPKLLHLPYEIVPINDLVTFLMVTDNATEMIPKLDSVRAKRTKFICLNDDMHDPEPETVEALRSLYESMFPVPSSFELGGQRLSGETPAFAPSSGYFGRGNILRENSVDDEYGRNSDGRLLLLCLPFFLAFASLGFYWTCSCRSGVRRIKKGESSTV